MKLKDYIPRDSAPFVGIRIIDPPLKVVLADIPSEYFNDHSVLGPDREEFYAELANDGLVRGKIYEAFEVEGFGDVGDVFVRDTDSGEINSLMDSLFEDAEK